MLFTTHRIRDLLMMPFFLWLVFYFWSESKQGDLTHQEMILWSFAVLGFFSMIYFIFVYQ